MKIVELLILCFYILKAVTCQILLVANKTQK